MGHYAKRFFGQGKNPTTWYNFNGNTNDLSGNGLNGTLFGGATILNDRLNVTANGRYMESADPTGIASFGGGAMTIACKINVATMQSFNWIANKRSDNSIINGVKAEWQVYLNGMRLIIDIIDSSKNSASYITAMSAQTLLINTTYHVAATFAGGSSNAGLKLYVNGLQVAATLSAVGSYGQMRNNGSALRLGTSGWDGNNSLSGWMDNFRLYNEELTANDIAQLANE